ncbi:MULTISPECIES: nitrous oxide reductase accessory protein NosL [Bacillaceae]|uniref:nitrous oxide reductase accessory protein NosL n=1 Tax=Bacillaceae TaxID=186817 RepID=UPI002FFFDB35
MKKITIIAVLAMLLIAGCGKTEYKAVAIKEKTDKCEVCNMAVKNNEFATEIILDNGKSIVFDDIGCMFKWIKENEGKKVANSYVKDYHSKDWIELEKASFVYDKSIKTPMAYNVISFSDKKHAESFIDGHDGKLLSYEKLQHHSWKRNKEMMKKMHEHMKGMDMKKSESEHDK